MLCGVLFGAANLFVGAADLLGFRIGFGIATPGFLGFLYAVLLCFLVFETILKSMSSSQPDRSPARFEAVMSFLFVAIFVTTIFFVLSAALGVVGIIYFTVTGIALLRRQSC